MLLCGAFLNYKLEICCRKKAMELGAEARNLCVFPS